MFAIPLSILTLVPLKKLRSISNFDQDCWYKFTYLMANSVDPDQANYLGLHCFKGRTYLGSAGLELKINCRKSKIYAKNSWNKTFKILGIYNTTEVGFIYHTFSGRRSTKVT